MKNNQVIKQVPVPTPGIPATKQVPEAGPGVIVGAVINKPQQNNIAHVPLLQAGVSPNPGIIHTVPVANNNHAAAAAAAAMATTVNQVTMATPQMVAAESNGDCGGVANTKEKTPMCLVNELARFNKIQHQYTLTDEQGPAHKKIFYVKLKLGEEEYAASGPSIKKAQHAAAAVALEKTQYKHPPPKPPRNPLDSMWLSHSHEYTYEQNGNITPTVELNALAMKRGEPAIYRAIEPQRPQYYPPPNFDFRGMYNQRYHYPRFPRMFYVSLKVGQREFIGEGSTRQMARHNAAAKALKVLKILPVPQKPAEAPPIEPIKEEVPEDKSDGSQDELKSEISLVHEIALKRSMPVNFEVIRESGPPHMRTFITRCSVGTLITEGEGNGKKVSKKRAAQLMLEELRKLPGIPTVINKPKKPPVNKKKNRNLIKVSGPLKAVPDYGVGINPISRLIQIQQAKKEKEPVYSLKAERGMPRRREFVMQVVVGNHQCTGVGPNKKLAKRAAAEVMLQQLGYSAPSPQPAKPAIKSSDAQTSVDKKVTFLDQDGSAGRQLVPGVLLMPDSNRGQGGNSYGINRGSGNHYTASQYSQQTTAAIAKELLDKGSSPTAESINKAGTKPTPSQATVRPSQQLLYLADVLGFQVQFTDFPKGNNKNDYLSLVSLSTNPPQVSHGAGNTIDMSHDNAALTALKALAEVGLDNVSDKSNADKMAGGDGPHVKFDEKLVNSKASGSAEKKAAVKSES